MKKLFLLLAVVGMIFTACTKGGDADDVIDTITFNPSTITVDAAANKYTVAVSSPCTWRAVTNDDWIMLETELGIDGKQQLIFSVPNYYDPAERKGEIVVSNSEEGLSAKLSVVQKAYVPEWTISTESLAFECEGGSQEVAINANFTNYKWTTDVDWLSIQKSEGGIKVTARPNDISEKRTAEITISSEKYGLSKKISVLQEEFSTNATNVIYYTSTDGNIVTPATADFGANIISNIYENGQGMIFCDAPVTRSGDWQYCSTLTSITLPDSVTWFEFGAFQGCGSLTSFHGKFASSDNRCLIDGDGNLWAFAPAGLTTYTIPDNVGQIRYRAFISCSNLTSITIPESVTFIGSAAFANCSNLTSITIPESVTEIGDNAFNYCPSLTSITIPDRVTSIKVGAFYCCSSLTSITIPDRVTSIGKEAFSGCSSLTSVTIGRGVTSIGAQVFSGCSGELIVDSKFIETNDGWSTKYEESWLYGSSFSKLTIGNNVTKIADRVFYDYNSLTRLTIPGSLTSIGEETFSVRFGTIYVNITDLAAYATNNCIQHLFPNCATHLMVDGKEIVELVIPDGVTCIGPKAFYRCCWLKSITIPESVTEIGENAFGLVRNQIVGVNCKAITPPILGENAFEGYFAGYDFDPYLFGEVFQTNAWFYVPTASVDAYKSAEGWREFELTIIGKDF